METRLADNAGGAGGFGGDSHPGEEPQTSFDNAQDTPDTEDWLTKANVEDYKFFYGNGQLHVADDYDYDDLASHAGVPADYRGPLALGRIHVDMGKATFEVESNLNAQALARILKGYAEQSGWQWGGMTDLHGEPVGTGSEFAPVKSYYYAPDKDRLLLSRSRSKFSRAAGAVHVAGNVAYIHGPGHEGLLEWANDQGITLVGGNDNVLKTIEDLEIDNNYTPEWKNNDEHSLFHSEPDNREPKGSFRCPECAQLFPSYRLYLQHRGEEDKLTKGDAWEDDGKFPELNMDATFPPNTSEPLKFYEGSLDFTPDPDYYYHVAPTTERARIQQHGLQPSYPGISAQWRYPGDTESVIQPGETGLLRSQPTGVYVTNNTTAAKFWRQNYVYPTDVWRVPRNQVQGQIPDPYGELGEGSTVIPHAVQPELHEPYDDSWEWSELPNAPSSSDEDMRPEWEEEYYQHEHEISPTKHLPLYLRRHYPGMTEEERAKYAATNPQPKDALPAPIPFLYDIQEDQIFVGQPGQRTSDIHGQFTPGGIVEGSYEPGGKVLVRTNTNMPYTVRHMLELWYAQHPELEIKGVDKMDDDGGTTKLAAGHDIGGYITAMVGADPTAFRASRALMQAGGNVYVVGGAVRDSLLGREPKDIDLMVSGLPSQKVHEVLSDLPGRVDLTGKDFGVYRYNQGGSEVEIALPRRERSMGSGHKDFDVQADHTMTPEEDLFRRDFTANAMAVDVSNGRLIDPFHGLDDLKANRLRTLNTKSLSDDPLRTVRALVAMSKHGLIPDRETKEQMAENASLIQHLPQERVQAELDKLFAGKNPEAAIRQAIDSGLMPYIFPEVDRAVGHSQNNPHHELDLGDHLINVMSRAKERKPNDPDFALAGLLHDIGKVDSHWTECRDCEWNAHGHHDVCPTCGSNNTSGHFYQLEPGIGQNHEDVGADQAYARLMALKYPKERAERIRDLIQHHMFSAFTSEKGARRFLNTVGEHADDLLDLRWADQGGKSEYPTDPTLDVDKQRELVNQVRSSGQATNKSQLAVNGNDIIQAGIPQGPQVGQVLQYLTEAVLENPELNTRDGLLGLVRAWHA